MAKIPADYLPPKELWAEYTTPKEFKKYASGKWNIAEEFLDRHVKEGRGDQVAILFGDQKITYKELLAMANKFANVLTKLGVEAQDRVGIRLTNMPEAIAINFGIQKCGAIPVPVSPLWAKEEVAFVLNNAEFKAFAVSFPLMGAVESGAHEFEFPTKIIVVGGKPEDAEAKGYISFAKEMATASDQFTNVKLNAEDIGVILFTSGTTGQPKGCIHFVKEVLIESNLVNKYVYKLGPGDVLGGSAAVSFAAGYGTFCNIPFAGGAAISLLRKFTPDDMMSTIQKHKITVITGLPTAYRKLLEMLNFNDYDLSSVRMYTTSGDALTGKTLAMWQAKTGKPIWEGLGGTEMMHLVTSNTMSDIPKPGSVGRALPGFEIKVVREDGTTAGPGEVGSMLIKGPTGTLYWKPNVEDNRLLKSMKKGIKDGYNTMGDAVIMDKNGFIFFQAREDDMIKSSGFRLAPMKIKNTIKRHPAVKDISVIGIPDEVLGQKVRTVVKLKPGYTPSEDLASDIIKSTMDVLAVHELPREVVFMDAIPRTPTGKILQKELRTSYPGRGVTHIGVIPGRSIGSMAGSPGGPGGPGITMPDVGMPAIAPDVTIFASQSLLMKEPPPRYADYVFKTEEAETQSDKCPLRAGDWYQLEIAVRTKTIGIPAKEERLPIREPKQKRYVTIIVTIEGDEFEIIENVQTLKLPPLGDSTENALFKIKPRRRSPSKEEMAELFVRLYYEFNLLEEAVITAEVVGKYDDMQSRLGLDTPITFKQQRLEREYSDFDDIVPRVMNINLTKTETHFKFNFTFYNAQKNKVIFPAPARLPETELENELTKIRDLWYRVAMSPGYTKGLEGKPSEFYTHVYNLARAGRSLWTLIFERDRESSLFHVGRWLEQHPLPSDALIQVSLDNEAANFIFPWGLLYDRKVPRREEDKYTLDKQGFWGLRYCIEQKPPEVRWLPDRPIQVDDPLSLRFMLWKSFPHAEEEISFLEELAARSVGKLEINFPPITNADDCLKILMDCRENILYFYAHGHTQHCSINPEMSLWLQKRYEDLPEDSPEREKLRRLCESLSEPEQASYIKLTNGRLVLDDLYDNVRQFPSRPFVFLNMCESAQITPSLTKSFVHFFLNRGASAVLGTECPMTVEFAHPFAKEYLTGILAGEAAGPMLLKARRRFMEKLNPLGLAYSLYGPATTNFQPPRCPLPAPGQPTDH